MNCISLHLFSDLSKRKTDKRQYRSEDVLEFFQSDSPGGSRRSSISGLSDCSSVSTASNRYTKLSSRLSEASKIAKNHIEKENKVDLKTPDKSKRKGGDVDLIEDMKRSKTEPRRKSNAQASNVLKERNALASASKATKVKLVPSVVIKRVKDAEYTSFRNKTPESSEKVVRQALLKKFQSQDKEIAQSSLKR